MTQTELILPKMGESVHEATITKWLKAIGDRIEADEPVVEIATDKVDSEIPSPVSGVLAKIMCKEGDTVKVGSVIALINDEEGNVETRHASSLHSSYAQPTIAPEPGTRPAPAFKIKKSSPSGRFYSPLVRKIALEEGVHLTDLESVPGSGQNGRVTKKDILNHLQNKGNAGTLHATSLHSPDIAEALPPPVHRISPQPVFQGNVEIIEMDRVRKIIAEHMVRSKHTSPHITSFVEADVTNIVNWRNKIKKAFEKREREKITYTPIFIEAVAKAIRDYPMVNVSVDGTKIIVKKNINIGMATALPSGNLIVPVIKNADRLNLLGLTKAVNDLANRARTNKLNPEEIQDGTFSITNVGSFGNLMGTPIINQPQAAILAVGIIKKKPVVIETPQGDAIAIRQMMFLSLSYDHRVVDGALGGTFLRKIADYLEQFDVKREYN